jgi:hypothetical protein
MPKPKVKQNNSVFPLIGAWAFMIGLFLAVLAGFGFTENPEAYLVLGVLGLIVGLVNIHEKDNVPFLVAAIAFVVAGEGLALVFAAIPGIGPQIPSVLHYIVSFVSPAAGVVAVKTLYETAR